MPSGVVPTRASAARATTCPFRAACGGRNGPTRSRCVASRLGGRRARRAAALPDDVARVTAELTADAASASVGPGVQAVLAAVLTSFVLVFGVAPFFKSSFKEDVPWRAVYADLVKDAGTQVVPIEPADAERKLEAGRAAANTCAWGCHGSLTQFAAALRRRSAKPAGAHPCSRSKGTTYARRAGLKVCAGLRF